LSLEIGIIGLGRMGANIARKLARSGHKVKAFNRTTEKAVALAKEEPNVTAIKSLNDFATALKSPRAVWVMVPAGDPTEQMIDDLLKILSKGDIIIDGGNSCWNELRGCWNKRRCVGTCRGLQHDGGRRQASS
jgi:6-phosphogluconate dehydrogenase